MPESSALTLGPSILGTFPDGFISSSLWLYFTGKETEVHADNGTCSKLHHTAVAKFKSI